MGMMAWHVFGSLLGLMLIVFFIVAVAAVARWVWGGGLPLHGRENALDILKNRYAKGEISKEEFDRIRDDLE